MSNAVAVFIILPIVAIILSILVSPRIRKIINGLIMFFISMGVGAYIGFLLRPADLLFGQVPAWSETARSYIIAGAIIGGLTILIIRSTITKKSRNINVKYILRTDDNRSAIPENNRTNSNSPQPTAQEITRQLQELAQLRDQGVLSQDEFQEQKQKILNRI